MPAIRPKVICLLRHEDRLLLIEATDPHGGRQFLFPPGGGVEFGETLEDALRREMQEELQTDLTDIRYLGLLENFFRYNNIEEHELIFVYEAHFTRSSLTDHESFTLTESNGDILPVRWFPIESLKTSERPVYPEGVMQWVAERE